jgi:hypothetical protein
MAVLQLSLTTGYVADWGTWEGIREIVQNALDAEQDGLPYTVSCKDDILTCTTNGAKLDRNVWLLGQTSKAGGDYRGHFGEGLKLGVLALVRAGHKVRIVNDDESWTPSIENSDTFGQPVLTIRTRSLPKSTAQFRIEVAGISELRWQTYAERFLGFCPAEASFRSETHGELLLDPAHLKRLYVKGIYVQDIEEHACGYNFTTVSTDRDRKMVSNWDLQYYAYLIWVEAIRSSSDLAKKAYDLLASDAPDLKRFSSWASCNEVAPLVKSFQQLHGEAALPVTSAAEAQQAEHYGMRGVFTSQALAQALRCDSTLMLETARRAHGTAIEQIYSMDLLSVREQDTLEQALHLIIAPAIQHNFPDLRQCLRIVKFRSADSHGQYDNTGEKLCISLARHCLLDLALTLQVLVHELAHCCGPDGDVRHERAEGMLFSHIICELAQASSRRPLSATA